MKTWMKLVYGIVLMLAVPASADVLCKSRKGAVKARAACQHAETLLDASALGLQGVPGPTGPQGSSLVVRDATGTFVGHPMERGNPLGVWRVVGTTLVGFWVTAAGVPDAPNGNLRYESSDCSGEPWVSVQPSVPPPGLMALLAVRASIGYFTVASSGTNVLIQSEWVGSPGSCSAVNFVSSMVRPIVVDLTTLVPPFRVEAP